jgi:Tfp pilus assembly protein PilN
MVEKNTVYWKKFSFSPSTLLVNMELAIKSISMQSAVTLSRPVIDGIILQGPNAEKLSNKLSEDINIEVVVVDGAGYTDSQCSYGLAMSAKSKERDLFDLFRELRPEPGIMQMFPWKLTAMILFMAGCMAFMMWQKASKFARSYNILRQQDSLYAWANNKQTEDIAKEREDLLAETVAVSGFLSSRIIWSDYLRVLPTQLPTNISLSRISATCEFEESGKESGGKRSLSFAGTTLFGEGRAAPEDIGAFMDSLRKVELLQRDFPQIELAEIRHRSKDQATFTVLALPKKSKKE